jgi:quinol monooxygenase YgiN
MDKPLLTVVAEIVALPEYADEVRMRLLDLIEPTRKEEGCVQYDLHEANDEVGRFFFYENWTSQQALDAHLASPHLTAVAAAVQEKLQSPPRIITCTRIA